MVRISNWIDALYFRYKHGHWCHHPARAQRSQLIDLGRRKVFWCNDCNWTWFV